MVGLLSRSARHLVNCISYDPESLSFGSAKAIIATIFLFSGLGMAEDIEYCYDHPLSIADWSDNATLPKFDPGLGEITAIQVRINFTLKHELNLKNPTGNATNISINVGGNLSLTLPEKNVLIMNANGNKTLSLDQNGAKSLSVSSNKSQSFDLSKFNGFVASSSGDMVILPVVVTSFSSAQMSGSAMTELVPRGAARVCITYEYKPSKRAD